MLHHKTPTNSILNQYLERMIADRTQGDDVVHSLKHVLKESIDTIISMDHTVPSFNVVCFMFTFLLESQINIFKSDVANLLNVFLGIYSDSLLQTGFSVSRIVEMDKFLDCLALNYDLFVQKYDINKAQLDSFNERLRHSFKNTGILATAAMKKQQLKRQNLNKEINVDKDVDFDVIDYNDVALHQQLSKYMFLQEQSSTNNEQIEFLNLSSLRNYSLDVHGEILFYLNFFNYNKQSKGRTTENENIMFKFLNYLRIQDHKYEVSLLTPTVPIDSKYKCFALINQFFILRSLKEPEFIVKVFNEIYSTRDNDIVSNLLISRRTMFSFMTQLIAYLKTLTFSEKNEISYLEDVILQFTDSCFMLSFKLQQFIDQNDATLNQIDLKNGNMHNFVDKLLFEDYLKCIDGYGEFNLYYYYFKTYILQRQYRIFGDSIAQITDLKQEMSLTFKEVLIELNDE